MKTSVSLPDKILGTDARLVMLWLKPMVLGVVILFSFILVIIPRMNDIPKRMAEIKVVKTKTVDVNQKSKYLQTTNQEEIRNNALKLSMGLLPEKSAYLLVGIVRNAAADVGYLVDDFSLSMVENKNNPAKKSGLNYDKLPVLVTLVGPTDNYIALVKSIERSLPIMSIDNLDARTSETRISTVKLGISAYYLSEVNKVNYENLSLADLTPNQDEINLLSKINEYKTMAVNSRVGESVSFTKYDRQDPFFIP